MKNKKLKIFIIAGEVSGDNLGARIMAEMPNAEFVGVGGENMRAAGLKSIFPMSDLAVMLLDVVWRVRTLARRIDQTAAAIIREKPDIVLTVDSPGFAKRVIKKIKHESPATSHQPRFYHVVAPQVWAWGGPGRSEKYAKIFDRMYAFFDFEVPYFTRHGLATIPVGHPIADGLEPVAIAGDVKTITLLPGSRMAEIKKLLPVFRKVAAQMPEYKYVIPVVETTEKYVRKHVEKWAVKPTVVPAAKRYAQYAKTDIAVATVGTATVELAIMHVPAVVVYRASRLTQFLVRRVINLKWLSLVNILLGCDVYPELLGGECTPENIIREIKKLTPVAARQKMAKELSRADKMWQRRIPAAQLIAEDIMKNAD
ncbi:MAG: lipid-A-disaccharide synthase [Alphaproteobacteria bacterium]|nr:lipid-A-disaccharide synthase [Alphaproteobacteria bacterium]